MNKLGEYSPRIHKKLSVIGSPKGSPYSGFLSPGKGRGELWRPQRIASLVKKVCTEICNSLDPFKLQIFVRKFKDDDSKLASLFCVSAWLAPLNPDYADVSVYSQSWMAKVYSRAGKLMPRLLLEATFGHENTARKIQSFMEEWELAEKSLTKSDLLILSSIVKKDRGPFLYWLLNERPSSVLNLAVALVRSPRRLARLSHGTAAELRSHVASVPHMHNHHYFYCD